MRVKVVYGVQVLMCDTFCKVSIYRGCKLAQVTVRVLYGVQVLGGKCSQQGYESTGGAYATFRIVHVVQGQIW